MCPPATVVATTTGNRPGRLSALRRHAAAEVIPEIDQKLPVHTAVLLIRLLLLLLLLMAAAAVVVVVVVHLRRSRTTADVLVRAAYSYWC